MATDNQFEYAPESGFHDMFDNQSLDNLGDLFEFSQYDTSFLDTWETPVPDGDGVEHEGVEPPYTEVDQFTMDAEADHPGMNPAAPSSANAFSAPCFLSGTNATPMALRQFTNDQQDLFSGFDSAWSHRSTEVTPGFPIHGTSASPATYMTPSAILSSSIFDLNARTQITEHFAPQRFTELDDEEPIVERGATFPEIEIAQQSSRPEIQFRRTEEIIVTDLPRKRYSPLFKPH